VAGLIAFAVLASAAVYLFSEIRSAGQLGFPIDDSWIHLVFARNISGGNGFSYNPGMPVAGSTAPLWTLLLAGSEFLPGGAFVWAKIWGILFLWVTGVAVYRLSVFLLNDKIPSILLALTVVCTPRMVWAGLSGMEITICTGLCMTALYLHLRSSERDLSRKLTAAALFALATLARPEIIAVFTLVVITDIFGTSDRSREKSVLHKKFLMISGTVAVFIAILLPVALLNLRTSDSILPTTFSAKGGQNGIVSMLYSLDFAGMIPAVIDGLLRAVPALVVYWAIDNILLLPFLVVGICNFLFSRSGMLTNRPGGAGRLKLLVIPLILIGLPVLRILVIPHQNLNHHMGRYITIITPLYIIVCGVGLFASARFIRDRSERIASGPLSIIAIILSAALFVFMIVGERVLASVAFFLYNRQAHAIPLEDRWPMIQALFGTWTWAVLLLTLNLLMIRTARWRRILTSHSTSIWFATVCSAAVIGTLYYVPIYGGHVKNIQDVQVEMGLWALAETPDDAVIATNDIGAIAYFSKRRIIDICGLVSPELMIPLESGEKGLIRYLAGERPGYLIIFPSWYPRISKLKPLLTEIHRVSTHPNLICGASTMTAYSLDWERWSEAEETVEKWK